MAGLMGWGLKVGGTGGSVYTSAAASLFARMTTQPDAARKALYNTLITSLQSAGVWSLLDALYVMAAHDSQAAKLNLIQNAFNLTETASPTFTTDRGFAGNGTSSYLKTGFIPSSSGGNQSLNSSSLGAWVNTTSGFDGTYSIGNQDATAGSSIRPHTASTTLVMRSNNNTSSGATNDGTAVGLTALSRTSSANYAAYKNGSQLSTISQASVALPTVEYYILALNSSGTAGSFTTRRVSAAFIGGSLTGTQMLALYNALAAYMTGVGA